MYLFEAISGGEPEIILKEVASKYNFKVYERTKGWEVNSSVVLQSTLSKINSLIILSEFPGNCSSLVLSSIQNKFCIGSNIEFQTMILGVAEEVCKRFEYSYLWVSLTDSTALTQMKSYGFKEITTIFNTRTGRENYFLNKGIY